MPAHHNLETYLDAYIKAAGIGDAGKSPLFRSVVGRPGRLTERPMHRTDAYLMIQRRAVHKLLAERRRIFQTALSLTTCLTIIGYNLFLQPYASVLFDAPFHFRTIDERHLAGRAPVCLGYFAGRKESLENAMLIESVTPRNASVPLLAVTKAEAVYVETRSRILKGTLAPGSAVNQEALAAELGVSITPLREALRRLEMEGLIRFEAHRTMIITPLTSQELHEMYAIRMELDPLAAGLAAVNGSKSQLELIRELAQQKAVSDPILQLERNRGFHRAVYSSSQNGALTSLLDQLWDRTDRYRVILIREELVEGPTSRQEHIDLAGAIGARKAAPAARLMRAHIERSHTRIADIVKTRATDSAERLGPGSQGNL